MLCHKLRGDLVQHVLIRQQLPGGLEYTAQWWSICKALGSITAVHNWSPWLCMCCGKDTWDDIFNKHSKGMSNTCV